ncbi:MAG: hypothetical protein ACYS8Z_25740, partial [Planctomycetota bacterium]
TPSKSKEIEFITLYRSHRANDTVPTTAKLEKIKGGYALTAKLSDGEFTALLPADDEAVLKAAGLESTGAIKCSLKRGGRTEIIAVED